MERKTIDINAYLDERQEIAVVWCIEDVHSIRRDLTDEQAWEVLQQARQKHDAGIGLNWSVLECHANMLFGTAPETDDEE